MKCRCCGANLGHINKAGEPLVRNAGMVMKTDGSMALICPKCRADVPFTPDFAKALQSRLVLMFKGAPDPGAGGTARPQRDDAAGFKTVVTKP